VTASVVVTGAASGMGRSSAVAFVKAGWRAVCIDRDPAALTALADELGDAFHPCVADVTDAARTAAAIDAAIDAAAGDGRLAAVANIAGIYPPTTLDTATEQLYRQIFDVNVLGTINVIKAAVPYLRANGGGSIVNFASVDAFAVSPGQLLYSASKAAVVSVTKSLAVELAGDHIVVNCIAPGWVDTPGNRATGRMADVAKSIPLRRVATPDEIADWVVHLAQPGYMTGETVVLSGGSVIR
jgi:3-oxoacyl-[acyl-carrier protein] reductase